MTPLVIALPIVLLQGVDPLPPPPPPPPPPATPSTPVATDGAAPAPPATPPPPLPIATRPTTPEPSDQAETGIGYAAVLGLGLANLGVDLPSKQTSTGGGAFVHLGLSGFWKVLSLRLRLSGLIGGGAAGFEGVYSAEAWVGAGARVTKNDQVFFRIGFDGYAFKNDELEASAGSVPGFAVGYQFWADGLGFEIAPRIALMPRSEYEPGDEAQGRRMWRRLNARFGYGGAATITTKYFFIDGSMLRAADKDPLTVIDGRMCLLPFHIALCGFTQYWRSIAVPGGGIPTAILPTEIPSVYVGGSIGIGIAGADADRLRWF